MRNLIHAHRLFCLFLYALIAAITASAIPAHPKPVDVTQSDGTHLTIRLVGDEFYHRIVTADGYTVLQTSNGDYVYAQQHGSTLKPSNVIAHNPQSRNAKELKMLTSIGKGLIDKVSIDEARRVRSNRDRNMRPRNNNYQNFRGLIILVNYFDKKFSMDDPGSFYDDLVNTHNFDGFTLDGEFAPMVGSVRDYYYDNSNHLFDPQFDVIGPVDISYICAYPSGSSMYRMRMMFSEVLTAADDLVDYSRYDGDGDGYMDMVFFIVAGFGSCFTGNNPNYLWPHMSNLSSYHYSYDGVYVGRYACSTEYWGWERKEHGVGDIGTICHEFSHILGLPDLYDTDYEESGGESLHPNNWSVMAGGIESDFGRAPVGYSLFERYTLGFATPTVINDYGNLELAALDTSNSGYRLNSPNPDEYFLIENRQPGKWDNYLPGHGMLVHRVDSTNANVWSFDVNEVNTNPDHMYYELIRADYQGQDSPFDPFPGDGHVTELNNLTTPNLLTWNGQVNEKGFADITERDGIVSFRVVNGDGTFPFASGDVDGDGVVGISDVVDLIDLLLSGQTDASLHPGADIDGDGVISVADVTDLIDIILSKQ